MFESPWLSGEDAPFGRGIWWKLPGADLLRALEARELGQDQVLIGGEVMGWA